MINELWILQQSRNTTRKHVVVPDFKWICFSVKSFWKISSVNWQTLDWIENRKLSISLALKQPSLPLISSSYSSTESKVLLHFVTVPGVTWLNHILPHTLTDTPGRGEPVTVGEANQKKSICWLSVTQSFLFVWDVLCVTCAKVNRHH